MVIAVRTVHVEAINAAKNVSIILGTRGGILLKFKATWEPGDYFNIGSDDEVPKLTDCHMLVTDTVTTQYPMGQSGATHPIVLPADGVYEWYHPEYQDITSCTLVGKLNFNAAHTEDPLGVVRGNLNVNLKADPNHAADHNVTIEVEFLAFDSAFA